MTAQRVLTNTERIGPSEWRWGCWELQCVTGYWFAFDTATDYGPDPSYSLMNERTVTGGFGVAGARLLLYELVDRGNAPLTENEVNALRLKVDEEAAR